jgi:GTP 3',8-cyclase
MSDTASQRPVSTDAWDRPLASLRISVIDRCDLRCNYCMPEEDYVWLQREDLLSFDEIERLTRAFVARGVRRLRLTGGEPLLRRDLPALVQRLTAIDGVEDLALTTNATQLERWAVPLRQAGLHRVTVSLDTLDPERFRSLTRRDSHAQVLRGIEAAAAAGFTPIKINTVVMRGFNDGELIELVEYGKRVGGQVRFIEYMDVGGATRWSNDGVVDCAEIVDTLQNHYGSVSAVGEQGAAPAQQFLLPDGTRFGVIASVSRPFCGACDRSRLTADGLWYLCLYAQEGINLRQLLRQGASDQEIDATLSRVWGERTDRGAEDRLHSPTRGALYQVEELKENPHREMHTRGG